MSVLDALAPQRVEPARKPERRLRAVTGRVARRRPRLAGAVLAVGGALAIGAAQMAISLASTQDAFVLAGLNVQQHELTLQKQALEDELAGVSSPQALAAKADAMGLVVVGSPSYLRLSDATVLGDRAGTGWISTVTPNGSTRVGNALLAPPPSETPAEAPEETATQEDPDRPPVLTDGLPSPTTR
ncbi:hypothetical protein [Microbacterium soli]|uniref:Cell division protein FtsL n=1 Tax=Microbacterium soli TaxID=446075 RepID=A0ABP7NE89_9MICO